MIAINDGQVTHIVPSTARVTDLINQYGKGLAWKRPAAARRTEADKPMIISDYRNARREAEYIARRNGQKAALIQLFSVPETAS